MSCLKLRVLAFGLLVLAAERIQGVASSNTTVLRDMLLTGYRTIPPPNKPVVEVQLALYSIVKISTPQQTMQIMGWWRHWWQDERLSWDAAEWGVESLVFDLDEIWFPDTTVYELIDDAVLLELGRPAAQISPSGDVFLSVPRLITVGCEMKLEQFPFDKQKCFFTLGSAAFSGAVYDILPRIVDPGHWFWEAEGLPAASRDAVDLRDFRPNTEFSLPRLRIIAKNRYYECCPEPFPVIMFEFEVDRQTATFMSGILVPLITVTTLGFTILLMPAPLSGARPGISLSVLFTITSIYLVAARALPEIGALTLIGRVYTACLVMSLMMVFISIISTGINMIVHEENSNRADLLSVFRHYDSDKSGKLDKEETAKALSSLGLKFSEREQLLSANGMLNYKTINLDDWMKLGEESRKMRPTVQYNILISHLVHAIRHFKRATGKVSPSKVAKINLMFLGTLRQHSDHDLLANSSGSDLQQNQPDELTPDPTARETAVPINGSNFGMTDRLQEEEDEDLDVQEIPWDRSQSEGKETIEPDPAVVQTTSLQNNEPAPAVVRTTSEQSTLSQSESIVVNKLEEWLDKLGVAEEVKSRFVTEGIDEEALSGLTQQDLKEIGIRTMGDRSKLLLWARTGPKETGTKRYSAPPSAGLDAAKLTSLSSPFGGSAKAAQSPPSAKKRFDVVRASAGGATSKAKSSELASPGPPRLASFLGGNNVKRDLDIKRKHHETKQPIKVSRSKHISAWLDFFSTLVFPTAFFLYICVEFLGWAADDGTYSGNSKASDSVLTLVELVDQRTASGVTACYGLYQKVIKQSNGLECSTVFPKDLPPSTV